jgi:glycosyltransferase involved in cell wall biosynthesis
MLKVGFDISQLAHFGGVATYTDQLTQQLSQNPDLEMVYFYSSLRKPYRGKLKHVKTFKLPPTLFEVLFNKIRNVGIEKFIGPVDVYHSSDWVQPPTKAKKVTTYHDVIPLRFPQWSDPKIVEVHKRRLELVEREVDVVIAVSETTKKDLLQISKIPEDKIKVIYEAPGKQFKLGEKKEIEEFRKKYNLPEEFILSIGGVGTRRNLTRVKKLPKDYRVIITGEDLPQLDSLEMPLLYGAATILLYPSFYEGFGLPILEAMSCGLPVIASNVSSMPEIGGEAALYINPESTDDIREKVDQLMRNQKLKDELIKKGLARSKEFSWEKTAEATAKVYESLVEG